MKFFGVIEAEGNTPFMLNMPILGLGITDEGQYFMGHITGSLLDMPNLGHLSHWVNEDFKGWVNQLESKFPKKDIPDSYKITVCTYKDACEKALKLYGDGDTIDIKTIGGPILKLDLRLIKNKLKNIIESE